MIIKDGKIYANLEEQVQLNADSIQAILEGSIVLGEFGIKVVGQCATEADLPDEESEEFEALSYGDAYAVGTTTPYEIYVKTRANLTHLSDYWLNLGQFPKPGPQGEQGEQGAKGDKGDTGAAGVGIASIVKVDTVGLVDTYTIIYDDGSTYNYYVTNGAQGEQGPRGYDGEDGKSLYTYTDSINDTPSTIDLDITKISIPTGYSLQIGDIILVNSVKDSGYIIFYKIASISSTTAGASKYAQVAQGSGAVYSAGTGIDISNNEISIDNTVATKSYVGTQIAGKADTTYVDAAIEVLDEDKQDVLTAGTGITIENNVISSTGGGESKIFEVTYGITSYSDIIAAINAGKIPVCKYDNFEYILAQVITSANALALNCVSTQGGPKIKNIYITSTNAYSTSNVELEANYYIFNTNDNTSGTLTATELSNLTYQPNVYIKYGTTGDLLHKVEENSNVIVFTNAKVSTSDIIHFYIFRVTKSNRAWTLIRTDDYPFSAVGTGIIYDDENQKLNIDFDEVQKKLIAGDNISVDDDTGYISCTAQLVEQYDLGNATSGTLNTAQRTKVLNKPYDVFFKWGTTGDYKLLTFTNEVRNSEAADDWQSRTYSTTYVDASDDNKTKTAGIVIRKNLGYQWTYFINTASGGGTNPELYYYYVDICGTTRDGDFIWFNCPFTSLNPNLEESGMALEDFKNLLGETYSNIPVGHFTDDGDRAGHMAIISYISVTGSTSDYIQFTDFTGEYDYIAMDVQEIDDISVGIVGYIPGEDW